MVQVFIGEKKKSTGDKKKETDTKLDNIHKWMEKIMPKFDIHHQTRWEKKNII